MDMIKEFREIFADGLRESYVDEMVRYWTVDITPLWPGEWCEKLRFTNRPRHRYVYADAFENSRVEEAAARNKSSWAAFLFVVVQVVGKITRQGNHLPRSKVTTKKDKSRSNTYLYYIYSYW